MRQRRWVPAGLVLAAGIWSSSCRPAAEGFATISVKGEQPRVAVRSDGTVAVVYATGDVISCRVSRDGGASYAPAVTVATLPGLALGMHRGPQIAATGAVLVVSAIGSAGDLVAWRSADRGRTWTGPVTVSRPGGAAQEGLHSLAAGEGDTVHAVWLEPDDARGTVLAAARSTDGRTWTPSAVLYRSPGGSICPCCQPQVAADGRGGVTVMWRNSIAGERNMYAAMSNDDGRTFGPAGKLGTGSWPVEACPMDGGDVAASGNRVVTVWRREDRIYTAEPGGGETLVGDGRNAVVGFGPGGAYMAWQTKQGIRLRTAAQAKDVLLGKGAFPDLAASEKGPVVLAWEASGGRVAALTLGGR